MSEEQNYNRNVVGIDLGTTNSVIAYVDENGIAQVIPSREGGRTIPSVFAIDENNTKFVGKLAVDQEGANPKHTVRSIKRKMGSKDKVSVQWKAYSPEEISAEILRKLKGDAEAFLGNDVTAAVITVPAYFSDSQRTATKVAGELAGLQVLRIINEPTAAALAYGLNKKHDETVLVYDLGGGTFDVTILEITDDGTFFRVLSTAGDTKLGGDDFDNRIGDFIVKQFCDLHPEVVGSFGTDEQVSRIREACEQAKKELSAVESATINIPYFTFVDGKPIHFKATITRAQFEEAIKDIIERTHTCVKRAIEDANLDFRDIDEVVFVGGSTRVPIIQNIVKKWTGKKPNLSVNPDEAVGLGAAIKASILTGTNSRELMLMDVTPLSLGIETLGGVMTVMIPHNTSIPTEFTDTYTTAEDSQSQVDIRVFQGERPRTSDNIFLGEFHLKEIPFAPRGVPKIDVTFTVDANGILSVKAIDRATGKEQIVTMTGSSSLSAEEIQRILVEADENKETDALYLEIKNAQSLLRDKLMQVESLLRDSKAALTEELIDELDDIKISLDQALESEHLELLGTLTEAATELIKRCCELVYAAAAEEVKNGNSSE